MRLLQKAIHTFRNLCFPFKENPAFEGRISNDKPGTELTILIQKILRIDVELALFNAELRMYEQERLKKYFEKLTTESNHSSRENLKRIIKLSRNRRPPGPDDEEGMGIPIR